MAAASTVLNQEFQIRMLTALAVSHWQKTNLNILEQCSEAVVLVREPNRSSLPSLALKRDARFRGRTFLGAVGRNGVCVFTEESQKAGVIYSYYKHKYPSSKMFMYRAMLGI